MKSILTFQSHEQFISSRHQFIKGIYFNCLLEGYLFPYTLHELFISWRQNIRQNMATFNQTIQRKLLNRNEYCLWRCNRHTFFIQRQGETWDFFHPLHWNVGFRNYGAPSVEGYTCLAPFSHNLKFDISGSTKVKTNNKNEFSI